MDIEDRSIREYLVQAEFVIPAYQRPYQWTDDLLEGLWSDLGELYTRTNTKSHYLGVLLSTRELAPEKVVRGRPSPGYGRTVWSLVDGQQRIVTILLLLAAIRDAGSAAIRTKVEKLISVDSMKRPRLLGQEEDRELLEKILLNGSPVLTRDEAKAGIGNAYTFFMRQLKAGEGGFWKPLSARSPVPNLPKDKVLKPALVLSAALESFRVTDMMLKDEDQSPPAVFDAINGKRRELDPVDLLRNTVFSELNNIPLFTKTWAKMESEARNVRLGSARLGTLPLFIDSYLHSVGEGASQYRLARQLNEIILEHAPMSLGVAKRRERVERVVDELMRSFEDFKVAQSSAFGGLEGGRRPEAVRALDNISMLSSGPPLPLSLLLLRYRRTSFVRDAPLLQAARHLESYLARRVIVGEPQQNMRSHLGTVTQKVIQEFGNASEVSKKPGDSKGTNLAVRLAYHLDTHPCHCPMMRLLRQLFAIDKTFTSSMLARSSPF